jgi:hypothetical protein
MRQDQPAGDQRIDDAAFRSRRPVVQTLQRRQIKIDDVVPGQIVEATEMLETGVDVFVVIFVNAIAVKFGDHDAMEIGYGVEESVTLDVECDAVARHRRFGGNDEALGKALKNIRTHGRRSLWLYPLGHSTQPLGFHFGVATFRTLDRQGRSVARFCLVTLTGVPTFFRSLYGRLFDPKFP